MSNNYFIDLITMAKKYKSITDNIVGIQKLNPVLIIKKQKFCHTYYKLLEKIKEMPISSSLIIDFSTMVKMFDTGIFDNIKTTISQTNGRGTISFKLNKPINIDNKFILHNINEIIVIISDASTRYGDKQLEIILQTDINTRMWFSRTRGNIFEEVSDDYKTVADAIRNTIYNAMKSFFDSIKKA